MRNIMTNSAFFGVMISILGYEIGIAIKKKLKWAIFNPLLIAIIFVMAVVSVTGVKYHDYKNGAEYLSYLLTPSTICLAIPLYEQMALLKSNVTAIIAGTVSGVLTSMISVFFFALLFHFNHEQYVTFLPKSITTAIGMGVSEELGGIVTITVATIIITGILGNMFAEPLLKWFKIHEPVAKGIAIGSSSHAVGTTKAMEIGEIEGAMSSLSIAVSGILTVFCAILFEKFI